MDNTLGMEARKWPLVETCDPSTTRGLYIVWCQMDPRTSRWYMTWASHIDDGPISMMAEQVKRERRFIGKEPDLAIMDSKGGHQRIDKERDEDWFMRFRAHGLDYTPNDEPSTLEEVDEWLKLTWDRVVEKMVPKHSITERVANIHQGPLWGLQRFQWDPIGMTERELMSQPGKDWIDCIKYFVNQKAVNRVRRSREREDARRKAASRHTRLAASYGFGRPSSTRRQFIWSPPTYR